MPHESSDIVFTPKGRKGAWKPNWLIILQMVCATAKPVILFSFESLFRRVSLDRTEKLLKDFWHDMLSATRTTVVVSGRSNLENHGPYIYMANHMSLMDIPVLYAAIEEPLRMLAKAELFRIPLFGSGMVKAGFVRIDRKDLAKAIKQLEDAKARLKEGMSIMLFPEGTRSHDLTLGPFKKGGFHVAIDLGLPVVPIWIEGAHTVIGPRSTKIHLDQTVVIKIAPPIATEGLTKDHIDELMTRVRNSMEEMRKYE